MAAHGAGQGLGVPTELGHPCSRCALSIEIQVCATDPAAPQCLDSLCPPAGEPNPSQKVISAEMVEFQGRIMHREGKKKKKRKTMYTRTQSTAALENNSNGGVGQTKDDALVCVCPRAEEG